MKRKVARAFNIVLAFIGIVMVFLVGMLVGRITWLDDEEDSIHLLHGAGITGVTIYNIDDPSKLTTFTGVLRDDLSCHVSGFRSASGDNWVLGGYEGPLGSKNREWRAGDLVQAARDQPAICHSSS